MRQCLIRKKYLVPKRRLSRFTSEKQHHFPGEQQFNDDIMMDTRNFEKSRFLRSSFSPAPIWISIIGYSAVSVTSSSFLYDFHVRALLLVAVQWVTDSPPARLKCQRQYLFNRFFFCTHLPINGRENINILVGGGNNKKTVQQGQLTAWNFHILGKKKKEIWYASHHRGLDAFDIHWPTAGGGDLRHLISSAQRLKKYEREKSNYPTTSFKKKNELKWRARLSLSLISKLI